MLKSKKLLLFLGLALVLTLAVAGVLIWFFSPGIHVIGTAAHLDAEKECYYVDPGNGEIIGQSRLMLKGNSNPFTGDFSGAVNLPEYPVEGDTSYSGVSKRHGYLRIVYTGHWFAGGEDGKVHGYMDTGYRIFVKDAENIYGLTNIGEDDPVMVVCADSEQEAMEKRYEAFYAAFGMEPNGW